MKLSAAIQRAREIKDAANGDTIPGDPDHGKWAKSEPGAGAGTMMATPATPQMNLDIVPAFNLPQRQLPPIAVAPDNLAQFNANSNFPTRRTIPPRSL